MMSRMVALWRRPPYVIACSILLRLLLRPLTYAAPDEHWQAPEAAYRMVSGYGLQTWEWWEPFRIRSTLHPLLIACIDWLGLPGCEPAFFLHYLLSIGTDLGAQHLALSVYRQSRQSKWACVIHMLSWFNAFGLVRPFANSLETFLVTWALALWIAANDIMEGTERKTQHDRSAKRSPLPKNARHSHTISVRSRLCIVGALAGISVAVRPTAAVTWLIAGLAFLWRQRHSPHIISIVSRTVVPLAMLAMCGCMLLDSVISGAWTCTPLNFFRVNALEGISELYGSYPWYWYLVDGLPAACGIALPLVAIGACFPGGAENETLLLAIILGNVAALSAVPHKEHRFLLPLSPLLACLAGRGMAVVQDATDRAIQSCSRQAGAGATTAWLKRVVPAYTTLLVIGNLVPAVYINFVHQRGPISAVRFIAQQARVAASIAVVPKHSHAQGLAHHVQAQSAVSEMAVHAWMPCHSIPAYAAIRAPIELVTLDCSPPAALRWAYASAFNTSPPSVRESDLWRHDPGKLLSAMYGARPTSPRVCGVVRTLEAVRMKPALPPPRDTRGPGDAFAVLPGSAHRLLPSHVVLFDTDARVPAVGELLAAHGFHEAQRFFHAHVSGDSHAPGTAPREVLIFTHDCWTKVAGDLNR